MSAVKSKQKPDDKAQSKRFMNKARELEADESGEEFERKFKSIVSPKTIRAKKARKAGNDS